MIDNNQLTITEMNNCLDLAVRAAQKAGDYLVKLQNGTIEISEESNKDIKLVADRNSETIIVRELLDNSKFSILAEENGATHNSRSDYVWIVDPLDGSVNYLEGIPLCCISIGLWQDDNPILGVIYDFNRHDFYTGIVNVGAWLNKIPITVKKIRSVQFSTLCTGFPASMEFESENIAYLIRQFKTFRKVRMVGSAALSLAFVASGKVDAYFEKNIKIWDVAAGLALVKAAGGEVQCNGYPPSEILDVFAGTSLELI